MKQVSQPKRAGVFTFRRWGHKSYSLFQALRKEVRIGVLLAAYTLLSLPITVIAQEDSLMTNTNYDLDEIEVSAQRSPVTFSQVARIISVIERDEIEAAPVQSVQELLEYALNVDVRQRGTYGVQADVSIRGGSSAQVLVLLNGINISDPQTGHHNFNLPVSLKNISRIEILEGPAARIYGPNAFSGAINIITGENKGKYVKADVLAGEHGLLDINLSGTLQTGKMKQFVAINSTSSNGYIDNTDFDTKNIFYQGKLTTKPGKLDIQLGYTDKGFGANSFYSPKYPNQYEATKTTFAAVKMKTGEKLHFTPALYWRRHQDRFELFRGNKDDYCNYHQTQVFGCNLNTWFQSKLGKTAFGAEFRSENIWSNNLGETMNDSIEVPGENGHYYTKSHSRTDISFFAEHSVYLDHFTASVGAMANWISDLNFDWNVYPGIDLSYQINEPIKLYTSFNTSMRMPTFTDLYYEGSTNIGNSDLKPEKSATIEGGIKYKSPAISGHVDVFFRNGKNIIDWVRSSEDEVWQAQNLTEIHSTGIESQIRIIPAQLLKQKLFIKKIRLNYSYTQLDKGSNNLYSNYVLDNLKHKFDLAVFHSIWQHLAANWQISWQDRNGTYTPYENGAYTDEIPYDPFWLVNLKLYWKQQNFEIYTTASNLFNITYNDIGNISQPGRCISLGINYQFNYK